MVGAHPFRGGSGPSLVLRLLVGVMLGLAVGTAAADEGGVSFWLPGIYSSLAAVPTSPGWSLGAMYFHSFASAGRSKEFRVGSRLTAGLQAKPDLLFLWPSYAFSTPVLGGQAALGLAGVYGRSKVSVDATLSGPRGRTLSGNQSDSLTGFGDMIPTASLRWKQGNHNFLTYTMLGVPVGSYEAGRLANLSTNHWSVDAGGGYTYLNPKNGHEFSAVAGLTYNFENSATDYQNGVDAHLDWAASQFLSARFHVGVAGYFYQQLTGDSGTGAVLGDFKSRVNGIGPEIGYMFPLGGRPAYVNLRGYSEFGAEHRVEGWNVWLTLSVPIGSAK